MKKFEWFLYGGFPMLMDEAGDEGGAAGDGGADGNEGEGSNSDGQTDGQQSGGDEGKKEGEGNQPEIYRPEGLPDHYVGENDQGTIDNLFKAVDGFRKELSKKQGVPEKLDDYKIELPEDLASKVLAPGEDGKDAVFEDIRSVLHQNGIPADKAVNIASAFYEKVAEKIDAMQGAAGDGGDGEGALDFEFKTFGGAEKAQPVIDANKAWIQGMVNQGKISKEDAVDMESNLAVGQGLAWMDKLRVTLGGGKPIPADMSGDKESGKVTEAELKKLVQDPRYRPGTKEYDPAFHKKVTEKYKEFYG